MLFAPATVTPLQEIKGFKFIDACRRMESDFQVHQLELPSCSSNQLKGFDMLTSKMYPLLINRWHIREENEGKMKN